MCHVAWGRSGLGQNVCMCPLWPVTESLHPSSPACCPPLFEALPDADMIAMLDAAGLPLNEGEGGRGILGGSSEVIVTVISASVKLVQKVLKRQACQMRHSRHGFLKARKEHC